MANFVYLKENCSMENVCNSSRENLNDENNDMQLKKFLENINMESILEYLKGK